MPLGSRPEAAFEAWARLMLRFRWLVIVLTLLATAGLATQLPNVRLDNTTQGFLHPTDPILLFYNDFRERFGRDELILIAIEPPEVFELEFLGKLRALHEDLEDEVPYVDEITSLVNARNTYGLEDELVVEDFLETWPQTQEDLAQVRKEALASRPYRNFLISPDGRTTVIAIRPNVYTSQGGTDEMAGFGETGEGTGELAYLSDVENDAVVQTARAVLERHTPPTWKTYMAGGPLITERLTAAMQSDIALFLVLSLLLIGSVLYILFRRISGVLMPLMVVVFALISTMGTLPLLDKPLSVITEILPPFLITVGVCDSIHILAIVYQRLAAGDSREESIIYALRHSGLAILMTSVTTAGGLLSFTTAELAHIAYLGILAPIGIMIAFVYSVTLLPALLGVIPLRGRAISGPTEHRVLDRILMAFADLSTQHPGKVVAVTFAILGVAILGAAQLRFTHNPMKWFPEEEPLRISTNYINDKLAGATILEVLIDTGQENGLHEPETLNRMDEMIDFAENIEGDPLYIGKAISIVDIVKETHRGLNENREEKYTVPQDRQLIAQELLLFENSGSEDLEDVTDSQFRTARITLKAPQVDAMLYEPFLDELQVRFQEILGDTGQVEFTGLMVLLGKTFRAVVISMGRSYVMAVLIITPLMILLLGSFKRGLLSMIPNLTPIVLVLGVMGWFDIPLDGSSLLVGSIILGLAVDDTIHFMHKFRRYYEETGDISLAIHETLHTTGAALLFTSVVLAAGFFIFMFGYMVNMVYFGFLSGFAAVTAFLADVIFAPALIQLVIGREQRRAAVKLAESTAERRAG